MKERFQIIKLAREAPSRPPKGGYTHQSIGRFESPLAGFWDAFGFWICLIVAGVGSYYLLVP